MARVRDFKASEQQGDNRDMEKDLKTELQVRHVGKKCQPAVDKHWGLLLGTF